MEINSSSLNYLSNGIAPSFAGKPKLAPNKNTTEELTLDQESKNRKQQSPQSPEQIQSTLDNANLATSLSNNNPQDQQHRNTSNFRSLQAINAYTATINQPKIEQRDNLIVGVDYYI